MVLLPSINSMERAMRSSWKYHETSQTGLRALAADTWRELRDPGMWIDLLCATAITSGIAFVTIAIVGR